MNRVVRLRCAVGILALVSLAAAAPAQVRHEIAFPDIQGYTTLKCDFHMHTVFSDGYVWPTVRVDEAWREGLDAIAITDHIEYQPHKNDVPTNHNRPYEIALPRAEERDILLIRGAEITRDTPPGHFNAIFLDDIEPLDTKDLLDAMEAASKQGAFIWWNHPNWKPDRKGWLDIHTELYEKAYLRGIEVVNGLDYEPEVHQWAMEKNLTLMGNSDIHDPSPLETTTPDRHRPMTLVFVKTRNLAGIKDALVNGRTAIWHSDQLIGKREHLEAIFNAAVTVQDIDYANDNLVRLALVNACDVGLKLSRTGDTGPRDVTVPPQGKALLRFKVKSLDSPIELAYVATNLLIGPKKGLPVRFTLPAQVTINIPVGVGQEDAEESPGE
jgi:hypothetical protein